MAIFGVDNRGESKEHAPDLSMLNTTLLIASTQAFTLHIDAHFLPQCSLVGSKYHSLLLAVYILCTLM